MDNNFDLLLKRPDHNDDGGDDDDDDVQAQPSCKQSELDNSIPGNTVLAIRLLSAKTWPESDSAYWGVRCAKGRVPNMLMSQHSVDQSLRSLTNIQNNISYSNNNDATMPTFASNMSFWLFLLYYCFVSVSHLQLQLQLQPELQQRLQVSSTTAFLHNLCGSSNGPQHFPLSVHFNYET